MHKDSHKEIKDHQQHQKACEMSLVVDKILLKRSVKYFSTIKLEVLKIVISKVVENMK